MARTRTPSRTSAGATRKTASTPPQPTRDPKGGLTAAGRRKFARTEGAHLKPGVVKPQAEMTPDEMRRKGSWAVRFYGRDVLPPLRKKNGEPTRFALSAHAWGEKVPATVAAARKIAAKGRALLKRYEATKKAAARRER